MAVRRNVTSRSVYSRGAALCTASTPGRGVESNGTQTVLSSPRERIVVVSNRDSVRASEQMTTVPEERARPGAERVPVPNTSGRSLTPL